MTRSYRDTPLWGKISAKLPERNRVTSDSMPVETYWTWDGHEIHLDHYVNPMARAKVILLHGVGGNGRLVSFIGAPLCRKGFEVIAPDLPPYGLSLPNPRQVIEYDHWVRLVTDLVEVESARDARPVFLFGLSAGGMLAYQVACINQKVKGIAATCLLDQRIPSVRDGSAINKAVSRAGSVLLKLFARMNLGFRLPMKAVANMRALVNDKALLRLLLQDRTSAGARVHIRFLTTMIEATPTVEPERFDVCPVLLVHPQQDRWVSVALSRLFFDRLACPKQLVLLENAGHFPIESPGFEQMEMAVAAFINKCLDHQPNRVGK